MLTFSAILAYASAQFKQGHVNPALANLPGAELKLKLILAQLSLAIMAFVAISHNTLQHYTTPNLLKK
jgi:hypothetical protein